MATGLDRVRFANPNDDRLPWEGNPISLSGRMRMIRTHAWKYVEEIDGTCELYDLIHDPYELVNLWNWPEHTAVQQELVSRLGAWKQSLSALAAG